MSGAGCGATVRMGCFGSLSGLPCSAAQAAHCTAPGGTICSGASLSGVLHCGGSKTRAPCSGTFPRSLMIRQDPNYSGRNAQEESGRS